MAYIVRVLDRHVYTVWGEDPRTGITHHVAEFDTAAEAQEFTESYPYTWFEATPIFKAVGGGV